MIKLVIVVIVAGQTSIIETKEGYRSLSECELHRHQLSFTYAFPRGSGGFFMACIRGG